MRERTYSIKWLPNGPEKRRGPIYKIVLDCPYIFYPYSISRKTAKYLIPSFGMMNELFQSGGKSPLGRLGTRWRPFSINEDEYMEIATYLENIDYEELKREHVFQPSKLIWDRELNSNYPSTKDWRRRWVQKYRGLDGGMIFPFSLNKDEKFPVYLKNKEIGEIQVFGAARGDRINGAIEFGPLSPALEDWVSCVLDKEYFLPRKKWYKPKNTEDLKIVDVYGSMRSLEEFFIKEPLFKGGIGRRRVAFKPILDPIERIPEIERIG